MKHDIFSANKTLIFGFFLVLLWSVRFFVENVKESQGGIEESLGLFTTGQWLSIPFIFVGVVFVFLAEKPLPKDSIENYFGLSIFFFHHYDFSSSSSCCS